MLGRYPERGIGTVLMLKAISIAIMSALTALPVSVFAADLEAGRLKSAFCVDCHGVNGISPIPTYPNLAGQKVDYLVKQMRDFRDGTRKDPIMNSLSAALSDADIANIAAYYSNIK